MIGEPQFTHHDAGTSDGQWLADDVWNQVPAIGADRLPLAGVRRLVVLAAHPDDETIGVGASVAAVAQAGVPVCFVLATAGERSHPDSTVWSAEQLAELRLAEWRAATAELAPQAEHVFLGLPDGGLAGAEHDEPGLAAALRGALRADDLVLAPWLHDGHPDHEAVGRAAQQLAGQVGARCLFYPVWWWHWNRPDEVRDHLTSAALLLEPGPEAVHRKHAALACYPSQQVGLGPGAEHGPVVTASISARARRPFEVLFGDWRPQPEPEATPAQAFDEMYDAGDDPWGWEDSWYERRRRSLVMAVLGRERLGQVLELGCGTGLLSAELAPRADRVTALDVSGRALEVARRRNLAGVTWHQGELPGDLPDGSFDVVVVSEVAYFLRPSQLMALLRGVRSRLAPGGEVVFADWARPTTGIPLDGPLVHELVGRQLGLPLVAEYRDDDMLVQAWSTAGTPGRREGLG